MVNVTITVDEDLLRRARTYALEHGTSLNALVRRYLEGLVSSDRSREIGAHLVARSRRISANSGVTERRWRRDELYDEVARSRIPIFPTVDDRLRSSP
jgi:plasmid stability protein